MGFRINQNMMNNNMLFNLQRNYSAMDKYQEQLSTGKKVSRPSDDPVSAVRGMAYRSSLNEIGQFKSNAKDGLDWMQETDSALDEVTQVMQRVRELAVQGSNDTNDPGAKTAIATEIKQLKAHLGEIANSEFAGKFIFAGTDTTKPPYSITLNQFTNTNQKKIEWQIGNNSMVPINVNGTDVFDYKGQSGTDPNLFQVLDNIVTDLESNGNPGSHLSDLDKQVDNLLTQRAEIGARMNRMDLSISRLDSMEVSATSLLSNEEDADVSKVIMDLKAQENVYRAALSVGARIIQPSLVDFLR